MGCDLQAQTVSAVVDVRFVGWVSVLQSCCSTSLPLCWASDFDTNSSSRLGERAVLPAWVTAAASRGGDLDKWHTWGRLEVQGGRGITGDAVSLSARLLNSVFYTLALTALRKWSISYVCGLVFFSECHKTVSRCLKAPAQLQLVIKARRRISLLS